MLRDLVMRGGGAARSLSLLLAADAVWRAGDESRGVALAERGWDEGRFLEAGADLWSMGQGLQALVISERLDRAREMTDVLLADGRMRGSMGRFVLASAYRGWIDAREGWLTAAEAGLRAALNRACATRQVSLCVCLWLAADVMLERPQCADLADLALGVELDQMPGGLIEAFVRDLRRLRHIAGTPPQERGPPPRRRDLPVARDSTPRAARRGAQRRRARRGAAAGRR